MFGVVVIVFQVIEVIFIGAFGRADSLTSTYLTNVSPILVFYLAITLLYTPYRKLFLTPFISLLLILSVSIQISLLFITFWQDCFTGFTTTSFPINGALLIKCLFSALPSLLTTLDFIPIFDYWQYHFTTAAIMTMGYCLIQAILTKGLSIYDGGGGLLIFLYSGICSLMIWFIAFRGNIDINKFKVQQSYISRSLVVLGIVVAFMTWPSFNMAGAVTTYNTILAYSNSASTLATLSVLYNSAISNTYLGLSVAILLSFLFLMKQQKIKLNLFIDCFINGGIVIASYIDIAINPVAPMLMVLISTVFTLILHRYFLTPSTSQSEQSLKYLVLNFSKVIYRVLWSVLGIFLCSIVVSTRDNNLTTGLLLTNGNYSLKAGLEIAGMLIVVLGGIVFGAITAVILRYLHANKSHAGEHLSDVAMFGEIVQEMYPLYQNSEEIHQIFPQSKPIDIQQYTSKVIKESLLRSNDSPLKIKMSAEEGKIKIDRNFSKKNIIQNVSKINVKEGEETPQLEGNVKNNGIVTNKSIVEPYNSKGLSMQQNVQRKLDFSGVGMTNSYLKKIQNDKNIIDKQSLLSPNRSQIRQIFISGVQQKIDQQQQEEKIQIQNIHKSPIRQ